MSVDLGTPEGLPQTGVYTSDQGEVLIGDKVLIRVQAASIRLGNSIDVYRETSTRFGTTYAGIIRVTGTITRAFINLAEIRLATGAEPGKVIGTETYKVGPGVIPLALLNAMMNDTSDYPNHSPLKSPYPPLVDIALAVNIDQLAAEVADAADAAIIKGGIQRVTAKRCMLNTFALNFDSNGLITNGPIAFQGGSVDWDIHVPTQSVTPPPDVTP